MELATSHTENTTSQDNIEVESIETEKSYVEDVAESNVKEPTKESSPERNITSPAPTRTTQESPVTIQRNKHVSENILDDLSVSESDSSDDGDFGSSSSDDYVCDTHESSYSTDVDKTPSKRRKTATSAINNITVPETPSPDQPRDNNTSESAPDSSFWKRNGMNSNKKKKKTRKSTKERREERVKRRLFRNTGLEYSCSSPENS